MCRTGTIIGLESFCAQNIIRKLREVVRDNVFLPFIMSYAVIKK